MSCIDTLFYVYMNLCRIAFGNFDRMTDNFSRKMTWHKI